MSPRLALELERHSVAPGQTLSGRVRIAEGGKSRRLLVALACLERTADYSEATVRVKAPPIHEGDLSTGAQFPFSLQLPPDALPNQSSPHGSIEWVVQGRSDELGPDTVEVQPFEVLTPPSR